MHSKLSSRKGLDAGMSKNAEKNDQIARRVFMEDSTPRDVSLDEIRLMVENREMPLGVPLLNIALPVLGAGIFSANGSPEVSIFFGAWAFVGATKTYAFFRPKTFNHLLMQVSNKSIPSRYHAYADYLAKKQHDNDALKKWNIERFEKKFPNKALPIEQRQPAMILSSGDSEGRAMLEFPTYQYAIEIFNSTKKEWLDKEMDVLAMVKYPLLSSPREPLAREFQEKLLLAETLKPSNGAPYDPNHPFILAAASMSATWKSLWSKAQTARYDNFTPAEEESLQKAYLMLKMAVDGQASLNERQIAYKRAMKELRALIVFPDKVRFALETSIGLKEIAE